MTEGQHRERRQAPHPALVLEPSFLFRMAPRLAWSTTVLLLCGAGVADAVLGGRIWFGPAYLAVIALAAWVLSARAAIAMGLLVMGMKIATGTLPFYSDTGGSEWPNLAVRFIGLAIVVGFIGMARRTCEREWRSARTDPLTGAFNRHAFFEVVENDQSPGGWSALVYADLDGLKALNDECGHAQGDQCLKVFAQTVRRTIRKGDIFARVGGDEFVIFMKLKNEEAGSAVGRRLHEALNGDTAEGMTCLKCSLGILLLPDGSIDIDAELRAADQLMYQAKQSQLGVVISRADKISDMLPSVAAAPAEPASRVRQAGRADEESPAQEQPTQGPSTRAAA
ncbi:GGDEF domain-containing protein [Novosphingobium sp.]|uniref:GGDEF domain-containing protein n=1 Tax=Novosphingobium sp. TaxID=1874826 RepID=UPI002B478334|nr:GGDEF domain-containing protein [Novosphingobium sp.]HKR91664.1 GGDEF domain-containing protein [Novosphingobium sp.]